eukprot:comp20277_c0_seq1/m.25426 comp20277_c0_seq1/g.25426  ORF comp20277_c0_seq1/g.25426 comp20277_c0_seq1/m.25426 type:complete len:148 (-) comp20277_c0_seq1:274-717(-)
MDENDSTASSESNSEDETISQNRETVGPPWPHPQLYGPVNVRGLKVGEVKLWCTCGLTKTSPWCDQSHRGTTFRPLRWKVPGTVTDSKPVSCYSLCGCKYTKHPPFCDAEHIHVPCQIMDRQEACPDKEEHTKRIKICEGCGWVPDW